MKTSKKSSIGVLLVLCMSLIFVTAAFTPKNVSAVTALDGSSYSTLSTAYDMGSYSDGQSTPAVILPANQDSVYFRFTINSGDKIYARCSYENEYEGMYTQPYDSTGTAGIKSQSPNDVKDPNSGIPFLALNFDGTKQNQVCYVRVSRGSNDNENQTIYFTLSLHNRIMTGNGTFNFSGSAQNSGNARLSSSGVDSSILKLDLTNNANIPNGAIVQSVTTSSRQTPSQGNVHHVIMPANPGEWYTSKVSNATIGSYNISLSDGILAGQVWNFKYNALATASSTMGNITINFNWQYDIKNTNYK